MNPDEPILQALAAARAEAGDEANGALFAFYERLLRTRQGRKAILPPLAPSPTAEAMRHALRTGTPLLRWDEIAPPPDDFAAWLLDVARLWDSFDPGALDEAEALEPAERAALARQWFETGTTGQGPTVDALVANALAPTLERAADALRPRLRGARWHHPTCPVCGGWPDFALWHAARRELLCERCATGWALRDAGCLFCGEDDPDRRGFFSSEDELYRVEVCDHCGHYLKGMDADVAATLGLVPAPAAERLLTPGLDLLAAQEGYARPVALGVER